MSGPFTAGGGRPGWSVMIGGDMRDMTWMPGAELEEDEALENYGNRMPTEVPTDLRIPERIADDQCDYCRAPAGCPHHVDCPEE